MDSISSTFPYLGAALGFAAIGFVPKYLRTRPKGWKLVLLLTFLVFFSVELPFLVARFPIWEAMLRAAFIGISPIVGGFLFVHFTKGSTLK